VCFGCGREICSSMTCYLGWMRWYEDGRMLDSCPTCWPGITFPDRTPAGAEREAEVRLSEWARSALGRLLEEVSR
jgi:hypothetical protein